MFPEEPIQIFGPSVETTDWFYLLYINLFIHSFKTQFQRNDKNPLPCSMVSPNNVGSVGFEIVMHKVSSSEAIQKSINLCLTSKPDEKLTASIKSHCFTI